MSLTIIGPENAKVAVGDIEVGNCFKRCGDYHIVTAQVEATSSDVKATSTSFNLSDGGDDAFYTDTQVTPVHLEIREVPYE
jgi:hypothetical protein